MIRFLRAELSYYAMGGKSIICTPIDFLPLKFWFCHLWLKSSSFFPHVLFLIKLCDTKHGAQSQMSWNPIQNWSILKRALFDPHPRQIRLNTFQMKPFYRKMNHLNSQNSQVTFPRSSTVHVVFLSLVSFRNQSIVFSITSSWQFALNQMRSRLFDSNRRPS